MGHWVCVGASPSAPEYLGQAVARWPNPSTIATNQGIELFDGTPLSYIFLYDMHAMKYHAERAKAFQARGTKLVTLGRLASAQKIRGGDHYDIFIEPNRHNCATLFFRGQYADCGYSGLWAAQFALNNGATHLAFVGMEGYRSAPGKPVVDYFDGRVYSTLGAITTQTRIGPLMRSFTEVCRDVQFVFYGNPAFEFEGPNVEIVNDAKPDQIPQTMETA